MKIFGKSFKLLILSFCLLGLADCNRETAIVAYDLKKCPPKDYVLPDHVKYKYIEISPENNSQTIGWCRNLKGYHVTLSPPPKTYKVKHRGEITFNAFTKVLREEDECQLLTSYTLIGASPDAKELAKAVTMISRELPTALFQNEPYSAVFPEKELKIVGDESEYKKWCADLK